MTSALVKFCSSFTCGGRNQKTCDSLHCSISKACPRTWVELWSLFFPDAVCMGFQGQEVAPCLHFPAHSLDAACLDSGPWFFRVWLSTVNLRRSALDDADYVFVLAESGVGV